MKIKILPSMILRFKFLKTGSYYLLQKPVKIMYRRPLLKIWVVSFIPIIIRPHIKSVKYRKHRSCSIYDRFFLSTFSSYYLKVLTVKFFFYKFLWENPWNRGFKAISCFSSSTRLFLVFFLLLT